MALAFANLDFNSSRIFANDAPLIKPIIPPTMHADVRQATVSSTTSLVSKSSADSTKSTLTVNKSVFATLVTISSMELAVNANQIKYMSH